MFIPPDEPLHVTLRIGLLLGGSLAGLALMLSVPGDTGQIVFGLSWVVALLWTVVQP